jgi:hypothetical protein
MKQSEPRPPTAIIVGTEWLVAQPYFKAEWQTTLNSLGKAKVWHQLGKRRPAITRAQLIEELSKWSRGQVPDSVIEELSKSRKVEVPLELSDKDVALLTAFVASFILTVSDVRTYTPSDLEEMQEYLRQEAQSARNEAAILKKHGRGAESLELLAESFEEDAELVRRGLLQDELDPSLFVERHQIPARACGVLLAKTMCNLYGEDMRGTVVAIAKALGHTVTIDNLRYWRGGNKNRKKRASSHS